MKGCRVEFQKMFRKAVFPVLDGGFRTGKLGGGRAVRWGGDSREPLQLCLGLCSPGLPFACLILSGYLGKLRSGTIQTGL